MRNKSVVTESEQIQLAIELIKLGARLQVLEAETCLSREKLLKLYKEIKGNSPPKGMLPFSTDWFITWQPNVHSSLFIAIFRYMRTYTQAQGIEAIIKTYKLYLEYIHTNQLDRVLSLTRAWTLVRFFDSNMLQTTACKECNGQFVVHTNDLYKDYVCGLCDVPSRAGKTKKSKQADEIRLAALN